MTSQVLAQHPPQLELVLLSKRPGATEWRVRNRCPDLQANIPALKDTLRRLKISYQRYEPDTDFKLKWVRWAY